MQTKIINIISHAPAYDEFRGKPRPQVNWDTPDGSWVGTKGDEFPDLLGNEILKITDEFAYEVWQPDDRADKIYSHRFDNGLVHRLFPAHTIRKQVGISYVTEIYSDVLISYLAEVEKEYPVIINTNGDFCILSLAIISRFRHLPVLHTFRGVMNLPETLIFRLRKNLPASFTYYLEHVKVKSLMPFLDYITYMNDINLKYLNGIYSGPKDKLTSGCDFNFWKKLDKQQARQELNLPAAKFIIFSSSRLIPLKQIDKLIEVLNDLSNTHDFLYLVSGYGSTAYEHYLKHLAAGLIAQQKIIFTGYLNSEQLRKYYAAADLFISTSIAEGGPVSTMKAFACETPVFSTCIGNTAEVLQQHESGLLVETKNYRQWKNELEQVLSGRPVKVLERSIAKSYYNWENIASKYTEIYQQLATNISRSTSRAGYAVTSGT